MKKKYKNVRNKYVNLIIPCILFVVLFLTVGYSAFSNELGINDISAVVRVQKDVRIGGISLSNASGNAISKYEDYNVKNVISDISLPNNNSSISFNIVVYNLGNVEMGLFDIEGLPSNLKYTIDNYEEKKPLCDDETETKCKLGATKTLHLKIEYDENGYDSNIIDYALNLNFIFKRVFSITYNNIFDNNYPKTIMEGETLEITFVDDVPINISVSGASSYTYNSPKLTLINPTNDIVINGAKKHTIYFNTNGGVATEETREVIEGRKIGALPTPTRENYEFSGWYTEENIKVTADTLMGNDDVTYFAHWEINISSDSNMSLSDVIANVAKDNIQVEINVYKDINDNITIANGQNILLNLQGNTLNTASTGNINVVVNNGTLEIVNGSITSNAGYAVIDNNGTSTLILKDVEIISTNKQGICNKDSAILYIEGNSYISSGNAWTIDNKTNATVIITGGTIEGKVHEAISNEGKLIIGTKDGNVDINSIMIIAGLNKNAIRNNGSAYFYDGTVKGNSRYAFSNEANIKEIESGYSLKKVQEVIDGTTYYLVYLEKNES